MHRVLLHDIFLFDVLLFVGVLTSSICCLSGVAAGDGPNVDVASLPRRVASPHLPNLVQIHPRVYVGGSPVGQQAADELKRLGVKTIISVDSAKPDLQVSAGAEARYVHLPIGYDSVTDQRAIELAKAIREQGGNIYLHCHHGHHRAPAAAAVACVTAGMISPEQAQEMLAVAGTAARYRGLYRSVENARAIDPQVIAGHQVEFREYAQVAPLAHAMVEIDHALEVVSTRIAEPRGTASSIAANLVTDPAHQALLLEERFTELIRMQDLQGIASADNDHAHDFMGLLEESQAQAAHLRSMVKDPARFSSGESAAALRQLRESCTKCHARFRNGG